jgi:hypothetical protein
MHGLTGIANQFMPGSGSLIRSGARLFGYGAYTTEQAETLLASRVPSMHATLDRGVRVAHHEFLGDVSSSTTFFASQYPINPGLQSTFPWLSTVASAFQEYELNGLVFYFKSTSANALNSVNTALGQIIGACQYNPYLPPPISKVEMLGLSSASDGKPSESNIYPVETKADMSLFRSKLVRFGAVADDLAKYDHANFFLGAAGSQAVATVGELHIVYDITLKKPKLWTGNVGSNWYYQAVSGASSVGVNTPLGTVRTERVNNLGVVATATSLTIPATVAVAGTCYHVRLSWTGVAAMAITYPSVSFSNCALINHFVAGGSSVSTIDAPINGVLTVACTKVFAISVMTTAQAVVMTIGTNGTYPTSSPQVDIEIAEVA